MSQDITVTGTEISALPIARGTGGLEGAERTARETALWNPHMGSPDQIINRVKSVADARGRDLVNNDGHARGGIAIAKDSIVGGHYRLNATPVVRVLKSAGTGSFDDTWAEEFQAVVEARFDLIAESDSYWLDAAGVNTFTDMIRLAVGGIMVGGEIAATCEWLSRDSSRPLATAIQMIAPARISNPNGLPDDRFMRRGVQRDVRGKPLGYHIRSGHPGENYDLSSTQWKYVAARKPWGRRQVIHIFEQMEPDQSRGVGDIVSVLKNMRMTKQFDELTLQRAVVDASYASAIESDLPPDAVYGLMGGASGPENFENAVVSYMSLLSRFFGAANVAMDGVKTPVLPPGTKMVTKSLGTPSGIGSDFGEGLLRHTAAALGISGEEFMNNFTKTSYSGLRGAFNHTNKRMKARKKIGADRFADAIYALVLEEEIGNGNVPLPRGVSREIFYEPLMKEAFCRAQWIGAGAGQIDELKETQAAILRIKSGLSTYEYEASKMGGDFREIFKQRAREEGLIKTYGLAFSLDTQKAGNKDPQKTLQDNPASGTQNDNAGGNQQ